MLAILLLLLSQLIYSQSTPGLLDKIVSTLNNQWPQVILDSIMLGNLYFLIAVGLTLIYAVVKFANFAHGDVATLGAYAAFLLYNFALYNFVSVELGVIGIIVGILLLALYKLRRKVTGLTLGGSMIILGLSTLIAYFTNNLIICGIGAALAAAIVSLLSHLLVYKPLSDRGATLVQLMVASIGVALFIRYAMYEGTWYSRQFLHTEIAYVDFGVNPTAYQGFLINGSLYIINATALYFTFANNITALVVGPAGLGTKVINTDIVFSMSPIINFTDLYIWSTAVVLLTVIAMTVMFKKTKIGKAWRAVANNPTLAAVCGINVEGVLELVWLVSGALAGIGGMFWAMQTQIYPELGWMVLLNAFAVAILGGLGSFWGTFVASYLLAFAEQLGVTILGAIDPSLTGYRYMIPFSVLVLVLILKPEGLAGLKLRKA